MELSGISRATGPSQPPAASRRSEDVTLALAWRARGAEPTLQRRSVEPVFHRPKLEPAVRRPEGEPVLDRRAVAAQQLAAPPPPAPPFEWLDLEIVPPGQKPDRRGYGVYSQAPQPQPVPVILIDTAA